MACYRSLYIIVDTLNDFVICISPLAIAHPGLGTPGAVPAGRRAGLQIFGHEGTYGDDPGAVSRYSLVDDGFGGKELRRRVKFDELPLPEQATGLLQSMSTWPMWSCGCLRKRWGLVRA